MSGSPALPCDFEFVTMPAYPPLRRRVLFVAYAFPPTGGVGVQRVTKFVKYLPEFGWDCSVVTVANPSVPLQDETLLAQVPPQTLIARARTLEPGYAVKQAVSASHGQSGSSGLTSRIKSAVRRLGNTLLQPDPQILWRPAAQRAAMKLLRQTRHDAIIATGPPFSSLLLGAALARKSGLPLVLDYRDEWGISNAYWENKRQGRLVQRVQQRMQYQAVRSADVLLATTPSSAAALGQVACEAGATVRTACIYNGFDSADFSHLREESLTRPDYGNGIQRFRLSYVGTLWNLNPVQPVVDGLLELGVRAPRLLENLELVFAGRRTAEQEQQLDRLAGLACKVVRLPFVSHPEACRIMWTSDGLLSLNADLPDANRVINAKLFEYMAARRPMFVVAPEGDLTELVRELPGSVLCNPARPREVADRLSILLEQHRLGVDASEGLWDIDRFERRNLAGELAELLDRMIVLRPGETSHGEGIPVAPSGTTDLPESA